MIMYSNNRRKITRRTFIATTAAAGALASTALNTLAAGDDGAPDLAVAHGPDAAKNTKAVIEAFGGIGAFVKAGQTVGLLPNAQGSHRGCSTDPTIVKTVVDLCKEAGASEVRWFTWLPENFHERANLPKNVGLSGATLVYSSHEDPEKWQSFDVSRGVALKNIRVIKSLTECDVFINMPIVKDHIGSRFTGSLKNYMGASHPMDNRPFHPTFEGENLKHMEQCIADLNTVVRPAELIIMDAMEILTSNGPFGPGDITAPQKIIAGRDRVAVDAYAATLLGLKGPEVEMIANANKHGLGEIELGKVKIKEIETA